MSSKEILICSLAAALGGVCGSAALLWFLNDHPLVVLKFLPVPRVARVNRSVETISAKRLVLVDDRGRTEAILGPQEKGSFGLIFYDPNEPEVADDAGVDPRLRRVASILVFRDGAAILRIGHPKKEGVWIRADRGEAGVAVSDSHGNSITAEAEGIITSLEFSTPQGRSAGVGLFDPYAAGESGDAYFYLDGSPHGPKESVITHPIYIESNPSDGPSLNLSDTNGTVRASLGTVNLESQRTGIITKRPASSLVLFGKNGTSIWQAP